MDKSDGAALVAKDEEEGSEQLGVEVLQPLHDLILVQPAVVSETTPSGRLFLPNTSQHQNRNPHQCQHQNLNQNLNCLKMSRATTTINRLVLNLFPVRQCQWATIFP